MPRPLVITLVIYFAGLGAAGQFSKLAVSFVELTNVYGGREATLGLTVSLISLVGVCLGLIAGMLVNRIGTKRALVSALFVGALVSLWQASLPALPVLMTSRVLEGASHLMIVVAAPTLIAETSTDRMRAAALTLWSTFFGVSFALTAVVAPVMIALGGLPTVLGAHGIWMAMAGTLCAWLLPASRPVVSEPMPMRSLLMRHAKAYATPGIATPALAWLCYTLTFVSVLTALPLLMEGDVPSWLPPIAPLVSIAVALTLGIAVLSRVRALSVVVGGFAISLLAAFFIAVVGFTATSVVLLFASMAFVQGAGFAIVPQLNAESETRALANGVLAQMGNLGNLSGTPIIIALHQGTPHWGPVFFLCIAYAAGLGLTWVIGRHAQRLVGP